MKTLKLIACLIACVSSIASAQNYYKSLPISGDDLKEVLDIQINKYQIDFGNKGRATIQVDGFSCHEKYTLKGPSKTAIVTVYIEKGPKSAAADMVGVSTLHYKISSETEAISCCCAFEDKNSVYTTVERKDGVFTIIAKSSKEATQAGYALKVYQEK